MLKNLCRSFSSFLPAFLVMLVLTYPVLAWSGVKPVLTITSGRDAPFVTPDQTGFFDQIVKQMFARINIEAKTVLLPSARSLINADTGIDDGNIARVKGIEKKYTNLIRVPEKVIDFKFVAYAKNRQIKISDWQSLKNYNIAYINGWRLFEKKVKYYKSLVKTRDSEQLFTLLKNNRVDIVLYDIWWNKKEQMGLSILQPPLASFELYLYLNKKHKALIPALVKALQEMKADGSYKRIYEQSLKTPLQ